MLRDSDRHANKLYLLSVTVKGASQIVCTNIQGFFADMQNEIHSSDISATYEKQKKQNIHKDLPPK